MMIAGFWPRLRKCGRLPPTTRTPDRIDYPVTADAQAIIRTLNGLATARDPVALKTLDGIAVGAGVLEPDPPRGLAVRLREVADAVDALLHGPLNATAASERGAVLFTMEQVRRVGRDVLLTSWPTQTLNIQSRQHFRVQDALQLRRRVALSCPSVGGAVHVCNLSEAGIGLEVDGEGWRTVSATGPVALTIDGELIPVPRLIISNRQEREEGRGEFIGARLVGVSEEHARTLRRWIVRAQCEFAEQRVDARLNRPGN